MLFTINQKFVSSLLIALALLANLLASHHLCAAQEDLIPVIEEYTMQPGDTLSKLAKKHLGEDAPWDTNLQYNSDLPNPNLIAPGTVVRILTGYQKPAPVEEVVAIQAIIKETANNVDKNIKETQWEDANNGDELQPRDGVRTLKDSTAVLEFDSRDEIILTENSQIYLKSSQEENNGITRNEIEITQGDAEFRLEAGTTNIQEFQIDIKGTLTTPQRNAAGVNTTKARLSKDSITQIMVFDGQSNIESGGVEIEVPQGMGTSAVPGEAPSAPEKLLEAPVLINTNNTQTNKKVNLTWEVVIGSKNYRLDLCHDRSCINKLKSIITSDTKLSFDDLSAGQYYWRVTAISPSGLDGFTASSAELNITQPEKIDWPLLIICVLIFIFILLLLNLIIKIFNNKI